MGDVTIVDSEVANTPTDYDIPAAQEIILKSITARFNGAAAAGNFVPTLQIIAPDGVTTWSYPATVLAAGASADVAWFPRVGLGAGFVPPAVALHGARAQNLGNYLSGTLSKVAGSPNVTGVGTKFTTELLPRIGGVIPGSYVARWYDDGGNNENLAPLTIVDDTHFTATSNALFTSTNKHAVCDQLIADSVFQAVRYQGVDVFDTDNYHFTSSAALSGTVTKAIGSATITGAGTSFTTQVSVNQALLIPGGGGQDVVLVKSIESDTSLTIWSNNLPIFAAAGQTAVGDPSVIGIPAGLDGTYQMTAQDDWVTSNVGQRVSIIIINNIYNQVGGIPVGGVPGGVNLQSSDSTFQSSAAGETIYTTSGTMLLKAGDYIRNWVFQNTGGFITITPLYSLTLVRVGVGS